jgi:opacity protein-like surface antigen
LINSGKFNRFINPAEKKLMKSYTNVNLKLLLAPTRTLLTSVILVLLGSGLALADNLPKGQPYFSLSALVAGADGATIDSAAGTTSAAFSAPGGEIKTDIGFGIVGAFGWLTDTNWRMEIELGQRQLTLDQVVSSSGRANLDGDLDITTGFVNVLRDFRSESFITPYVGIGIGAAYHELDVSAIDGASPDFGSQNTISVAYQAMAGLNFEVGDDMDVFAGYRFTGAWEPDYDAFALERLDIHHFEMGLKFYVEEWFK